MERARSERHPLDTAGLKLPAVAERVGVLERALDDVGQPLDVGVGVHRPIGARDEPVVVEDAERADPHLRRVAVLVEGEVPARVEPPALLPVDVCVAADLKHRAPPLAVRPGPRYSGSFQAVRSQSSIASACGRNVGSSISTLPAKT